MSRRAASKPQRKRGREADEPNRVECPEGNSSPSRSRLLNNAVAVATIVAALGAIYFGYQQNSINSRLMQISQVVAVIAVVDDSDSGEMLIRNTGKMNLYLAGFELGSRDWVFQRRRLIAANAGGDPGYPIRPGKEAWEIISKRGSATLTLFLEDELQRKWVSQIGFFRGGEERRVRTCSYETARKRWELRLPRNPDAVDSDKELIEGASFVLPSGQ